MVSAVDGFEAFRIGIQRGIDQGFPGALIALAYLRTSAEDPGTTTATAALVAYLLGALAYSRPALAVALAVVVAGLLVGTPLDEAHKTPRVLSEALGALRDAQAHR